MKSQKRKSFSVTKDFRGLIISVPVEIQRTTDEGRECFL